MSPLRHVVFFSLVSVLAGGSLVVGGPLGVAGLLAALGIAAYAFWEWHLGPMRAVRRAFKRILPEMGYQTPPDYDSAPLANSIRSALSGCLWVRLDGVAVKTVADRLVTWAAFSSSGDQMQLGIAVCISGLRPAKEMREAVGARELPDELRGFDLVAEPGAFLAVLTRPSPPRIEQWVTAAEKLALAEKTIQRL